MRVITDKNVVWPPDLQAVEKLIPEKFIILALTFSPPEHREGGLFLILDTEYGEEFIDC